ncbi:glycosyltransferase family 9 protein [Croceivirga lutea]|uniref:glycosyltransferase family 9 protein n=1 Tax=Croceivirga lutea TaxID=1775167 RepID=UPI0028BEEEAC|nr:glycosyltransferase family 9 protein [Croceivirga lutea]
MIAKKDNRHLLVIRLSAMGDVAMLVPVLLALHKTYPHIRVTVLTKPHFKPIFSDLSFVNVYSADVKGKHKGFFGLRKLYKELVLLNIDAVADTHNVLRSKILSFFFKLKGIQTATLDKGRKEKKQLTTWKAKKLFQLKSSHERYALVFKELGFHLNLNEALALKSKPTNELLFFKNENVVIGIAPFASFEGKAYPLHLMEKTIALLQSKLECEILLFGGGQNEKEKLDILTASFYSGVHNITNRYNFKEELAIISNLSLMLSMDSGNGHLAANYGIPVLTIWGVTHPCLGFSPFRQPPKNSLKANREQFPFIPTSVYGNKMPENYRKAIATVTPDAIVKRILEILDNPKFLV